MLCRLGIYKWSFSGPSVYCIAINDTNIFAGTYGEGIFMSTDNGASWNAMNTGIGGNTYIESFAISGQKIFAGTYGGGVFIN